MPHTQSKTWLDSDAQYLTLATYTQSGKYHLVVMQNDGSVHSRLKPFFIVDLQLDTPAPEGWATNKDLLHAIGCAMYDLAQSPLPLPQDR